MARQVHTLRSSTSSQLFWLAFIFVILIVSFNIYQFWVISTFSSRTNESISNAFRLENYNEELGQNIILFETAGALDERQTYRRNIETILRKMRTLENFASRNTRNEIEEAESLVQKIRGTIDEIQSSTQVYFKSRTLDYLIAEGKNLILQQIDLERKRLSGYLHESQLFIIHQQQNELESLRRLFQFSSVAIVIILLAVFFFITRPALLVLPLLRSDLLETEDKLDKNRDETDQLQKEIGRSQRELKKQKAAIEKMKETTFLAVEQHKELKAELNEFLFNAVSRLKHPVKALQKKMLSDQTENKGDHEHSQMKKLLSDLNQQVNQLIRASSIENYHIEYTRVDLGRLVSEILNSMDKSDRLVVQGSLPAIFGNEDKIRFTLQLIIEFCETENQDILKLSSEMMNQGVRLKLLGIPSHKLRILDKLEFLDEERKSDDLDELALARQVLMSSGGKMIVEKNDQGELQLVVELTDKKKAR